MTVDRSVAADFAKMGIKIAVSQDKPELVVILPANHASFDAFMECQTQWITSISPAGIFWQGLNYPAVKLVLDDIEAPSHVFADIRLMEAEALSVLNQRNK
ncbi:DUF1799 domain-containing protein [Brucella pituitosa]|uniref:DUF1799 domain-containing protein n=1 Tax=Brucella pituitosa TaxID=571256 RepID=UPI003F4AEE3D